MLSYVTESSASFTGSERLLVSSPPTPFPIRPESLVVRISQENSLSIRLFQRLGFIETKATNAFGEKEMRFRGANLSPS